MLAIVNPFSVVFMLSIGWQLAIAVALLLPLWGAAASVWIRSRTPAHRAWLTAGLAASALAVVHLGVPTRRGTAEGPSSEPYQETCAPLGSMAKDLGLEPDDLLVDPRVPAQFALYHVTGACNLDPARLRSDAGFRGRFERAGGRVVLIAETPFTLAHLYNDLLREASPEARWYMLEAGSMFFRLERGASPPAQLLDAPIKDREGTDWSNAILSYREFGERLTVSERYRLAAPNTFGSWLAHRSGPQYMAGWPLTILGDHPSWQERRQAFLFGPEAASAVWIEVRDSSEPARLADYDPPKGVPVVSMGRVGARLGEVDRLLGYQVERVVFLNDNAMTSPVAEVLARDLMARGGEVLGYVTAMSIFHVPFRELLAGPPLTNILPNSPWLLLAAAILASITIHSWSSRRLARRVAQRRVEGWAAIREWEGRALSALGPTAVGWAMVSTAARLPGASSGLGGLYLIDTGRVGLPALSLLAVVAHLLLMASIITQRPQGERASAQLVYWSSVALGFAGFVLLPMVSGLTVFEAAGLIAVVGAPGLTSLATTLAGRLEARRPVGLPGAPWRVVPLRCAELSTAAGQKARWLSMAAKCAPAVPEGFIILTTIRSFGDGSGAAARLSRAVQTLGPGLRIVRSSSPGEDELGKASAGRFESLSDVKPGDEAGAVARVLASYAREGIDPEVPVGVIVQEQVQARLAGVATREAYKRGGGLLVEAAGDTSSVTSGHGGGILWGRIGAFSLRWIGHGPLGGFLELSAASFADMFALLERRFRCPLTIEWAFNGRQLIVLQVRPAPIFGREDSDQQLSEGIRALAPSLSQRRFQGQEIVLSSAPMADLQYGASACAISMIRAIYHRGARELAVGGGSFRALARAGPNPHVVSLDGGLYLNQIPRHVLAQLLLRPFASWQRQWWRASPGRALARVHRAVEEARVLLIAAAEREAGSGVSSAWSRCCRSFDWVTGVVARDFFDAGLVAEALGALEESTVRTDPILAWIAGGASGGEEIAGALPYRSVREWALEHPRLGEGEGAARSSSLKAMLQAFMDRERCFPPVTSSTERAARLLALARDNLSFGVAMLRWDLIELGAALGLPGDAVFQRSWEDLAASVGSGVLSESAGSPRAPDPRLPVAFSLVHLEAWAAGERDAQPEPSLGFWVSGSGPITGRVVTADAEHSTDDEPRIQVVRHPDVRDLAALPDGVALVALGGNRLSHTAQVLRERGTPALFGAEAYAGLLAPGARVVLGADGRVTRAG